MPRLGVPVWYKSASCSSTRRHRPANADETSDPDDPRPGSRRPGHCRRDRVGGPRSGARVGDGAHGAGLGLRRAGARHRGRWPCDERAGRPSPSSPRPWCWWWSPGSARRRRTTAIGSRGGRPSLRHQSQRGERTLDTNRRPSRREGIARRVIRVKMKGRRPLVAHCHLGLGKLYRRTGKREQAREHPTTATTMYREMGMFRRMRRRHCSITAFRRCAKSGLAKVCGIRPGSERCRFRRRCQALAWCRDARRRAMNMSVPSG